MNNSSIRELKDLLREVRDSAQRAITAIDQSLAYSAELGAFREERDAEIHAQVLKEFSDFDPDVLIALYKKAPGYATLCQTTKIAKLKPARVVRIKHPKRQYFPPTAWAFREAACFSLPPPFHDQPAGEQKPYEGFSKWIQFPLPALRRDNRRSNHLHRQDRLNRAQLTGFQPPQASPRSQRPQSP